MPLELLHDAILYIKRDYPQKEAYPPKKAMRSRLNEDTILYIEQTTPPPRVLYANSGRSVGVPHKRTSPDTLDATTRTQSKQSATSPPRHHGGHKARKMCPYLAQPQTVRNYFLTCAIFFNKNLPVPFFFLHLSQILFPFCGCGRGVSFQKGRRNGETAERRPTERNDGAAQLTRGGQNTSKVERLRPKAGGLGTKNQRAWHEKLVNPGRGAGKLGTKN